uniref:Uncharacterized protein n=1 Tax=Caenorhabditis japonica TaxID=281687 RepID=A0A8R1IQ31_CAEJA
MPSKYHKFSHSSKASIRTNFRPSGPSVRPSVRRPSASSAVRPVRPRTDRLVRFVRFVRRAEIERMRKKSREAENRHQFCRRCVDTVRAVGWQVPAALGAVLVASLFYHYRYVQ